MGAVVRSGGPVLSRRDILVREQEGDAYTLALGDNAWLLVFTEDGSSITVTVPDNEAVPLPIGAGVTLVQGDAQPISVAGADGVTVLVATGLSAATDEQDAVIDLVKIAEDTWLLYGHLAEAAI